MQKDDSDGPGVGLGASKPEVANAINEFNEGLRQAALVGRRIADQERQVSNPPDWNVQEDEPRNAPEGNRSERGRPSPHRPGENMEEEARQCAVRGAATHAAAMKLVSTLHRWFWERHLRSEDWARPMPPEDYLSALNILREFGWQVGIETALGFALHHSREEDVRLERVRSDIEAYTGRGRAFLVDEEHLYLYDPARNQSDVSSYGLASLQDIRLSLTSLPTWRVLRLDLLPNPHAPYIGEREHRIRYSCLDDILVPPSHQVATQSKSDETLVEASDPDAIGPGPRTVTEQPAVRETEDSGKTLESWKEILPETCNRLGKQVSEKTARELFKKHGIKLEDRRGVVCVSLIELAKLPKPGAADV